MKKKLCLLSMLVAAAFVPCQVNAQSTDEVVTAVSGHIDENGHLDGASAAQSVSSSAVNESISQILYGDDAKDWMKRTDIQFSFRENWKPVYAIETIQPLNETELSTVFTQFRIANTSDIGTTANLGFGYRKMNATKTTMYGINTFYDYGFKEGHARLGGGLEYFNGFTELRTNLYHAVSGEKEIDRTNHIFEKALSGYDAEIGYTLPKAQWAKFYLQGFRWDYKHAEDTKGYRLATEIQLTPQIGLEVGYIDESRNSGEGYAKLMYNLAKKDIALFSGKHNAEVPTDAPIVEHKRLDKVRRENDIRVERYQKDENGNVVNTPGEISFIYGGIH